jgi:hypothetical protein
MGVFVPRLLVIQSSLTAPVTSFDVPPLTNYSKVPNSWKKSKSNCATTHNNYL